MLVLLLVVVAAADVVVAVGVVEVDLVCIGSDWISGKQDRGGLDEQEEIERRKAFELRTLDTLCGITVVDTKSVACQRTSTPYAPMPNSERAVEVV